jgi:hypothetical protein
MEPSYGWLIKARLAFFDTVVSLLCGNGVAAHVPVGRAKLPTVRGDAVVFERAVPRGATRWGPGVHAEPQPALRAKCDPHNKSCSTKQRLAWCTRNGWRRHWGVDDGKMSNKGPRPSKSKLPLCVRCETDGARCWGPPVEIISFKTFIGDSGSELRLHPTQLRRSSLSTWYVQPYPR